MATVAGILLTETKGQSKSVAQCEVKSGAGLTGDMHKDDPVRQVSLMGQETTDKMIALGLQGLCTKKFVVNITTRGARLYTLRVGRTFRIGNVLFEVTKIGKECFAHCEIEQKSLCPLPRECLFARALGDGVIHLNDEIRVI